MSFSESDEAPLPKQIIHYYSLHNQVLENVPSAKYLGITITDDLDWGQHINSVTSTATRTLGFLRRNLTLAPKETKLLHTKLWPSPIRVCSTYLYGTPITKQKLIEYRRSGGLLLAGPVDACITRVTLEKCKRSSYGQNSRNGDGRPL